MSINKIPETFGSFDRQIAFDSLSLIKEAYEQFKDFEEGKYHDWEADENPICVNGKTYKRLGNLGFAHYFFGRKRVPFGFIVQQEDTQDIYVVFRGTSRPEEWISNLKFLQSFYQQDHPSFCKSTDKEIKIKGKIHHGFNTTYTRSDVGNVIDFIYNFNPNNDFPSMEDQIEKTLKKCPENSRLFVTGHSLGGALATISTLHIHLSKEIKLKPILYSFASPRVGDQEFASNFEDLECYRIANSEDMVPQAPLPISLLASARLPGKIGATCIANKLSRFKYHHIGMPIYFTQGAGDIAENHSLDSYLNALGIDGEQKRVENRDLQSAVF